MKKIFLFLITVFLIITFSQSSVEALNSLLSHPAHSMVIAVDPGHGGYDPGAVAGNILEKDINLKVCLKLKKYLEAKGAKVFLTRDGDYNHAIKGLRGREAKRYDLDQRIKLINSSNADILITVHTNSSKNQSYEGAETFYHEKSEEGKVISEMIQNELRTIPGMYKRIIKPSSCYLLRNTKIPAVLVEIGYLSNPNERKKLQIPEYQSLLAKKICQGVLNYYGSSETLYEHVLKWLPLYL